MSMAKLLERWEPVIGLECHVQLATTTKAFTAASAAFGGAPNTHVDPYTLGLPGTLPVLSRATIEAAVRLGLAAGCRVRTLSRFSRKHYFYPDLPKGYQISQYDEPLCEGGAIEFVLDGKPHSVRLTRIHVEEDAGKNTHVAGAPISLLDLNRAGVPLCEIVSEPDLRSPEEAGAYLRAIRQLVRWIGISDGNMEEGSLRCDANVSLRPRGATAFGTKTELKNINSFKFVEAAIAYEIARQADVLERGGRVVQETRLWSPTEGVSKSMRSKESAHDYRYFPEPDLPPLRLDQAWIDDLGRTLPELPMARSARYVREGLSAYDASVLTAERELADYFDAVAAKVTPKLAANWISTELLAKLKAAGKEIGESPVGADALAELIALVEDKTISGKIAKDVFDEMWATGRGAKAIVADKGLTQVTDAGAIEAACREVVAQNAQKAAQYRAGKVGLLGFFVGQVMKATGGRANPEMVNQTLKRLLEEGQS
jgi:aspartyl-tRNA(Asn)/glutamyl-tRNA(Gln) amidotransferase subunit B